MKRWYIITLIFLLQSASSLAFSDTLYIVKQDVAIGITNAHFCSFLQTNNFNRTNSNLQVDSGDTLNLAIINQDTLAHTFTIKNVIETGNVVAPSDTLNVQLLPLPDGTYRYYSNPAYGKYLGASGVIQVGYEQYKRYCWNLFDIDVGVSNSIATGQSSTIPTGYLPSYFTINGNYYPDTAVDTATYINGNLNDTIIISVVNSGNIGSSFHFHGYHVQILNAKINTTQVGWSKDSMPILKGEAMTFMLVAYQTGLYPIHAHNLVATTTGGIYPGGMITTIEISP
jgi:FtsP/CotA-like multicopper oxidase with cupredoxin domain